MIHHGDALTVLETLPDESVQTCVTSPPYWGLRNYDTPPMVWGGLRECAHAWASESYRLDRHGDDGSGGNLGGSRDNQSATRLGNIESKSCEACGAWQGCLGLEPTPKLFVEHLVAVFREVKRVLRADGTLFLNLGDSYHGGGYANHKINGDDWALRMNGDKRRSRQQDRIRANPDLKPKDLVGIPWMTAFALREDGWTLRADIIWSKPNPMPESVKDRPTRSHEYVFLLTKSKSYFYDIDALREPHSKPEHDRRPASASAFRGQEAMRKRGTVETQDRYYHPLGRNRRSVWTIPTTPFPGAHFATFPEELPLLCVKAGSRVGDTVLDPFTGSGTTGVVAEANLRKFIGIEANAASVRMAEARIRSEGAPLFQGITP